MIDPDFSNVSTAPERSVLDNVTALVARLRLLEAEVAARQADLDSVTSRYNDLVLRQIPEAMDAAQLTELKLQDGARLVVKDDLNVTVTKENQAAAYAWLRANGHGEVVRETLAVDLRGVDAQQIDELWKALEKDGLEYTTAQTVHAATLKSLVKGLLTSGVQPPPSIGVYEFKKASIKEPRK